MTLEEIVEAIRSCDQHIRLLRSDLAFVDGRMTKALNGREAAPSEFLQRARNVIRTDIISEERRLAYLKQQSRELHREAA